MNSELQEFFQRKEIMSYSSFFKSLLFISPAGVLFGMMGSGIN